MSSMNPLATGAGGITDRDGETGRCSLFDDQDSNKQNRKK